MKSNCEHREVIEIDGIIHSFEFELEVALQSGYMSNDSSDWGIEMWRVIVEQRIGDEWIKIANNPEIFKHACDIVNNLDVSNLIEMAGCTC